MNSSTQQAVPTTHLGGDKQLDMRIESGHVSPQTPTAAGLLRLHIANPPLPTAVTSPEPREEGKEEEEEENSPCSLLRLRGQSERNAKG